MILPIVAYGDPVLKKKANDIDPQDNSLDLKALIENMFETMYAASGVGLAAPQIGLSLRLFVVDAEPMDEQNLKGFKKVFINPQIIEEQGNAWAFEEGCLSIPHIRENVERLPKIKIKYFDENWQPQEAEYDGMAARVIQHEYDHIEGILFTDHLSSFKKTMLRKRLSSISNGQVKADYKMKFYHKK
ncbi:MAG: peptide deformylase [Cytophagales bacterium]|nr:MAG: peptide deformylase [Cytophagales bacterium]